MEEVEDQLAAKVQALSDLELAVLICLVADQHCIIESDLNQLNDIEEELKLVSLSIVFGVTRADKNRLREMSSGWHVRCFPVPQIRRLMTLATASWLERMETITSVVALVKRKMVYVLAHEWEGMG
jgi:hypothetical protein